MAPLRSPILSAVARTSVQRIAGRQSRQYATARARAAAGPGNMEGYSKRSIGTLMMFMPVVALTMFWPYAVPPVMHLVEGVKKGEVKK